MKKLSLVLMSFIGLFFLSSLYSASPAKIGIVDFQAIFKNSPKVIQAQKDLKTQFEPKQNEIKQKQQALKDMQAKMKRDSAIMRENDKTALKNQISANEKELLALMEDFNKKLYTTQQGVMTKLIDEIRGVIAKVAEKQQLDLVIPKQSLLYAKDQLDITAFVEKELK